MRYEKPPLATDQMIQKLNERKMVVGDVARAREILDSVNYYRLATYWHEHRITTDTGGHVFRPGTSLEQVFRTYEFDGELRALVFRSIEIFEVSLRKRLASHLALEYEPFAHLNPTLMKDRRQWADTVSRIHSEYVASNEEFARHHREKYGEHYLPPIWVTVELMTLGGLRHLFQNWAHRPDRQAIARLYGMDCAVFESLLQHLEMVRNICAHHSRLWNRNFTKIPKLPRNLQAQTPAGFNRDPESLPKIYNTLVLLDYVDEFVSKNQRLLSSVGQLLDAYPSVDPKQMGFPKMQSAAL